MKSKCERNPMDKYEIDYDPSADFDICAASYTPIYDASSSSSTSCPYDGSKYQMQYKGSLCRICDLVEIGAPASGLRLI